LTAAEGRGGGEKQAVAQGGRWLAPAELPAGARLPDFFIVGQPKSGTTALYQMLRRHPQIFMPDNKEPWFFAAELQTRTPPRPAGTPHSLCEYAALFAGAQPDQRVGEATPLYLWSRTAAQAIAETVPGARIIAILREPASLLRSLHLQFVETYIETEPDLRSALELEGPRREGRHVPRHTYWPQALAYSEHVRYVEQLRRYHERFPPERVLVLIYDDYRRDNAATVRTVLRFLEVDETIAIAPAEVNPTVGVRSPGVHRLVHALTVGRGPVSRAAKAALKRVVPTSLRRDAVRAAKHRLLYAAPGPADEELMAELRRRYRPEVVSLSRYLGRDLVSEWGYASI
jgi:Sulfotransferase family